MPEWKHTLTFKPWYHDDRVSITNKGKLVSEQLKLLKRSYPYDEEFGLIIEDFVDVETVEQFDQAMMDLYDWCDVNRVWVVTQ